MVEKEQKAFELLKEKWCEKPLLQRSDFSQPFILTTDASGFVIGGKLSQGKIGNDKAIVYTSRSLNDNERKYNTYEKEALANIHCVTYFRPYLYGRKFTLVTDHKSIVWFQNPKDPCSRIYWNWQNINNKRLIYIIINKMKMRGMETFFTNQLKNKIYRKHLFCNFWNVSWIQFGFY